ncbi:Acetyltransferase (GNAT) domain-containing protein [Mycolicibacterium rutilum]|uniref:Acetyltransferase (GNAT) domain-containing protein n=1 Tax=Mycolicibacterium rutilum TaxID=370526 RepID=A0A1H6IRQ2_MYCRU|nr:GNAT family N-acetyltransferase [Mycolicibacterium rutilum]SEH48981.1 Acetyltransferase (GNAT) domain-containing protein [Mycolicibacterium rutilum]
MSASDHPLFASTALAERIEHVEAQLISAATEAAGRRTGDSTLVLPVAGGAACLADAGSPMNKVVGLGFGGVPGAPELDAIEQAFAERDAPVQVELSSLGDPQIADALTGRGYRLVSFENVLGRSLLEQPRALRPDGVEVRRTDDLAAWLDVVVEGFAHPDVEGVPSHEEFPREIVENAERDMLAAGAESYLAYCDGAIAGGAGMRMSQGVAQLVGAATVPAYRRRGVQSALLATRLIDAADAGCDIAVVTTQPGSRSQQNVQRSGFHLLYTRAVLVR